MRTIDDFPSEHHWAVFRLGLEQLKVKIKSLAEEARIIRHQEQQWTAGPAWSRLPPNSLTGAQRIRLRPPASEHRQMVNVNLHQHRVEHVRPECRAAQLAYAFLRNIPYDRVEQARHTRPPWDLVERLIKKYGMDDPRNLMQQFSGWKALASLPKEMK